VKPPYSEIVENYTLSGVAEVMYQVHSPDTN